MSKILVIYTDGTENTFEYDDHWRKRCLDHAASEILETVAGCDFAVGVDSVYIIDDNDNVLETLYCKWGLTLVDVEGA